MSETLDLTTLSDEPVESNVQVEITDAPEEAEGPVEAPEEAVEEPEAPVEEPEAAPEEPEVPEVPEAAPEETEVPEVPEEAPEETADPVEEAPVSSAPVEQVAADIRNILTEVPAVSTDSSELSDDLKQRIAELDYLRECCGNWVGQRRKGKSNFLTAWESKNVSVDTSINYEAVLNQLEKMPEIIRLWAERKVNTDSNHFKNLNGYTLTKPLFNGKSLTEKVEVLEQLVGLLTDCANGKMRTNKIEEVIDNLY